MAVFGGARTLLSSFAEANVKFNNIELLSLKNILKHFCSRYVPLPSSTPHEFHMSFPLHIKKKIIHFSLISIPKIVNKSFLELNASQIIHFLFQPTHQLTFKISDKEAIFQSTPHPSFDTRFNSTFNFLEVYQAVEAEPNSCIVSIVIIQNITHRSAIFSPG